MQAPYFSDNILKGTLRFEYSLISSIFCLFGRTFLLADLVFNGGMMKGKHVLTDQITHSDE